VSYVVAVKGGGELSGWWPAQLHPPFTGQGLCHGLVSEVTATAADTATSGARPWDPPETEFPAIVPITTLQFGRSEQTAIAITGRYDVPQHLAPETSDALRFCAVEGDLELLDRRHWFTIEVPRSWLTTDCSSALRRGDWPKGW
jgi:hypothetical protein